MCLLKVSVYKVYILHHCIRSDLSVMDIIEIDDSDPMSSDNTDGSVSGDSTDDENQQKKKSISKQEQEKQVMISELIETLRMLYMIGTMNDATRGHHLEQMLPAFELQCHKFSDLCLGGDTNYFPGMGLEEQGTWGAYDNENTRIIRHEINNRVVFVQGIKTNTIFPGRGDDEVTSGATMIVDVMDLYKDRPNSDRISKFGFWVLRELLKNNAHLTKVLLTDKCIRMIIHVLYISFRKKQEAYAHIFSLVRFEGPWSHDAYDDTAACNAILGLKSRESEILYVLNKLVLCKHSTLEPIHPTFLTAEFHKVLRVCLQYNTHSMTGFQELDDNCEHKCEFTKRQVEKILNYIMNHGMDMV